MLWLRRRAGSARCWFIQKLRPGGIVNVNTNGSLRDARRTPLAQHKRPRGGFSPKFSCAKFGGDPDSQCAGGMGQSPRVNPPVPAKPSLLIVEDDQLLRHLLVAAAERTREFLDIMAAPDGRAALDWLRSPLAGEVIGRSPLYVLSDLSMPRMNGLELLRELKRDPATREIPVVIVTSSNLPNDRQEAIDAGCTAFFYKPDRFDQFTEIIASLPRLCRDKALTPVDA